MSQFLPYKTKVAIIQVISAMLMLLCGCGIYILFRSKSLNIYKWCTTLGLSDGINSIRYDLSNWNISEFVKYSLPDGLYCAAYILIIDAIWHKETKLIKYAIIFFVPFIAISSEVLQYFGVVRGTFDWCDLVCYAIPPITYLLYIKIKIVE